MDPKQLKRLAKSQSIQALAQMFNGEVVEDALVLEDDSSRKARLKLREGEHGPEAIGSFSGLQVRLRAKVSSDPYNWDYTQRVQLEVRLGIWGPNQGLMIAHKDQEVSDVQGLDVLPTTHPILSRTVVVRSVPHPSLTQLLEDDVFVSHLLSIVHQYPRSSVQERWITLKVADVEALDGLELLRHMVYVGKALEKLAIQMREHPNSAS